ncbi:MAG: hypothetical protein AAGE52_11525 [Myxococcota bacterium]
MTTRPFPATHHQNRTYFVTFLYFRPGGRERMKQFMDHVGPLWTEHGMGNAGTLDIAMKRAVEGENNVAQPDQIRFNYAEDMALFKKYQEHPLPREYAHLRDEALERITILLASENDITPRATYEEGDVDKRLYVVQLIDFKPKGEAKLDEFYDKAAPLFQRYGFHFDYMLSPLKKLDAKGDSSDLTLPQKVVLFHADDPDQLGVYNQDPEYLRLAPIREAGVAHNRLFGGRLIGQGVSA